MEIKQIKLVLEGVLLAAGRPMSVNQLGNLFDQRGRPSNEQMREALKLLGEECEERAYELREVGSGFRFQVKQDYTTWVGRLWEEKPPRYSRALMETLALIAYRQPITRGEIEGVRGVAVSSNIIRTLLERDWVKVVGQRDVPGKPSLYGTTKVFLDYFNMKSLKDMPPLPEIKEIEPMLPPEVLAGGQQITLATSDGEVVNEELAAEDGAAETSTAVNEDGAEAGTEASDAEADAQEDSVETERESLVDEADIESSDVFGANEKTKAVDDVNALFEESLAGPVEAKPSE